MIEYDKKPIRYLPIEMNKKCIDYTKLKTFICTIDCKK